MSAVVAQFEVIRMDYDENLTSEIVRHFFDGVEAVRWCKRMNIMNFRENFDSIYFLRQGPIVTLHPF